MNFGGGLQRTGLHDVHHGLTEIQHQLASHVSKSFLQISEPPLNFCKRLVTMLRLVNGPRFGRHATLQKLRKCVGQLSVRTKTASFAVSAFANSESNIPQRLTDRPGRHRVAQPELLELITWGRKLAEKHVAYFSNLDGSPDLSNLSKELDWLVTDCIEEIEGTESGEMTQNLRELVHDNKIRYVRLRWSLKEIKTVWTRRIHERVPLQYLTNTAHWRDIVVTVSSSVLIPRPETELLVEFAKAALSRNINHHSYDVPSIDGPWLDLGTGSGVLAISLAQELHVPQTCRRSTVYAVDCSAKAIELAKYNALRNGVQNSIEFLTGSWFEAIDQSLRFAGILTNPPYIPTEVLASLQAEVQLHEPHLALDGGSGSGTHHLAVICAQIEKFLTPGGFFGVETHGHEQSQFVFNFLTRTEAFDEIRLREDYSGKIRFVTAFRKL